ncbi:MAG: anthranilate phosphoribosyltransferase [Pirellulales bacterium]|nr:anthranilate phosphoribosyltransferase [Pirellulales bacterium]
MIAVLGRLSGGQNLSQQEMTSTMDAVMRGELPDEQIALLLMALRSKGETVEELAGAAVSLRRYMTRIRSSHEIVIDTCGTGGVGSKLFNISTAAALVVAAAGVPVAKHGNRAVTSRSGSADVLTALGVNIAADVATVERCLHELGICFCFAPMMHPSMKRVGEVRRRLGVPTIFNLLGPLCNPAGAPFQLLGVGKPELRQTLAQALALLGTKRSAVVSGEGNLGEVTIAGTTWVAEVTESGEKEHRWTAADFGLSASNTLDELAVEDAQQSAAIIRRVLSGDRGVARDIVVANAAAALWVVGKQCSLSANAQLAQHAIDSGAAQDLLQQLARITSMKP